MSSTVIVVGVDGSPQSACALEWGIQEALLRDGAVEMVTATAAESSDQIVEDLQQMQKEMAESVLRRFQNGPAISRQLVRRGIVDVLADLSVHACLVVVGRHGTSSLVHAGLGSVADACARLCWCPVVVVPAAPRTGADFSAVLSGGVAVL